MLILQCQKGEKSSIQTFKIPNIKTFKHFNNQMKDQPNKHLTKYRLTVLFAENIRNVKDKQQNMRYSTLRELQPIMMKKMEFSFHHTAERKTASARNIGTI